MRDAARSLLAVLSKRAWGRESRFSSETEPGSVPDLQASISLSLGKGGHAARKACLCTACHSVGVANPATPLKLCVWEG